MEGKRGPPPTYVVSDQSNDNPAFITDPYSTQYSAPLSQIPKSDPYSSQENYGPKPPQELNAYGFPVNPVRGRQGGYGQYNPTVQTVVVTQPATAPLSATVPDYMGLALFVTICCCWPIGVVAITRNSEARRRSAQGNISGAHESAASAKRLSIWGIVIGFIFIGVTIGIAVGVYVKYRPYYYNHYYYG